MPPSTSHTFGDEGVFYDVHKIMEAVVGLPAVTVPLAQLIEQLDQVCWSDDDDSGRQKEQGKFSPREVAEHWQKSAKYKFHYDKAMASGLEFPIIIRRSDGIIIDGMHRLLKAYMQKSADISAVYIDVLPESARIA